MGWERMPKHPKEEVSRRVCVVRAHRPNSKNAWLADWLGLPAGSLAAIQPSTHIRTGEEILRAAVAAAVLAERMNRTAPRCPQPQSCPALPSGVDSRCRAGCDSSLRRKGKASKPYVGTNLGCLDWARLGSLGLSGKRDTNCHALPMGVGGRSWKATGQAGLSFDARRPQAKRAASFRLSRAAVYLGNPRGPSVAMLKGLVLYLRRGPRYLAIPASSASITSNNRQPPGMGGVSLSWLPTSPRHLVSLFTNPIWRILQIALEPAAPSHLCRSHCSGTHYR